MMRTVAVEPLCSVQLGGCSSTMHDSRENRINTLEHTVRRQGRALMVLGGLLTLTILAGATMQAPKASHVIIDKPVKIILEDIGFNVRSGQPLPIITK